MAGAPPEPSWRGLLRNPTPDLKVPESPDRCTTAESWHKGSELGQDVALWSSFNQFVGDALRSAVKQAEREPEIADSLARIPYYLYEPRTDYVSCGNESTMVGRFFEHVANSVNCIASILVATSEIGDSRLIKKAIRDRFGDGDRHNSRNEGSASAPRDTGVLVEGMASMHLESTLPRTTRGWEAYKRDPDMVACKNGGEIAVFVGEAKTPWKHSLTNLEAIDGHNSTENARDQAKFYLWQIARYMKDMRLKHGCLTNYEQTVFLKMAKDSTSTSWRIECSPVVNHDTETNQQDQEDELERRDPHTSAYSLRECFFAVVFHCMTEDDYFEGGNDDDKFIVPRGSKLEGKGKSKDRDKYDSGSSGPGSGSAPGPSKDNSKHQDPSQRQSKAQRIASKLGLRKGSGSQRSSEKKK